jgi:UDP-N-acetylmuramoyl-tripeptide--D-alanyl-D-alanine ligase
LTASFVQAASKGSWVIPPRSDVALGGVSIDSRGQVAGCAFVAISGPRHDGHDFVQQALEHGATMLVVEREVALHERLRVPVLRVADTKRALRDLAGAYRRELRGCVIAVTGSAGKTTTKHLIHAILGSRLRGSAAPRSFNNDIGVPLTILNAKPDDNYLVAELGTNAPGEIELLATIAAPEIAVITSIGHSHLERLGSVEAVAREKASLLNHVSRGGLAILHDTPILTNLVPRGLKHVRFGCTASADLRLTDRGSIEDRWWFELNAEQRFETHLPGEHNAMNAMAAIAVARHMRLSDEDISRALLAARSPSMRMARVTISGIDIHNDAYNANPESMAASLKAFGEMTPGASRRVLLLGDMLELGEYTTKAHLDVLQRIRELHAFRPLGLVVLIGPRFGRAAAAAPTIPDAWGLRVHEGLDDVLADRIAAMLQPGDSVLVKGSRGMAMERIVDVVAARCDCGAGANQDDAARRSVTIA